MSTAALVSDKFVESLIGIEPRDDHFHLRTNFRRCRFLELLERQHALIAATEIDENIVAMNADHRAGDASIGSQLRTGRGGGRRISMIASSDSPPSAAASSCFQFGRQSVANIRRRDNSIFLGSSFDAPCRIASAWPSAAEPHSLLALRTDLDALTGARIDRLLRRPICYDRIG